MKPDFQHLVECFFPCAEWKYTETTMAHTAAAKISIFYIEIVQYSVGAMGRITVDNVIVHSSPNEQGLLLLTVLNVMKGFLMQQIAEMNKALYNAPTICQ